MDWHRGEKKWINMEFESQWNGLKIRFKREGSVKTGYFTIGWTNACRLRTWKFSFVLATDFFLYLFLPSFLHLHFFFYASLPCRGEAGRQDEGGEFVSSEVFAVPQCHLPAQNWSPHPHQEPLLWRRQRLLQPQPRYKVKMSQVTKRDILWNSGFQRLAVVKHAYAVLISKHSAALS